jgi:phosphatidylserine/phosphatidylglycerophosphate/cardiolipin synthase-like enzyme
LVAAAALGTALAAAGCKTLAHPDGSEALASAKPVDCTSRLSPLGAAIVQALATGAVERRFFWDLGCDNRLDPDWLVLTPPLETWGLPRDELPQRELCSSGADCDVELHMKHCAEPTRTMGAQTATSATKKGGACTVGTCTNLPFVSPSVCSGHSDTLMVELYEIIARAKQRIEITTLGAPDDPYLTVIRRALLDLNRQKAAAPDGETLDVRILGTGDAAEAERVARSLALGQPEGASRLRITAGVYGGGGALFNHSKIVVVDGVEAIVGGHNWWASDYNRPIPLFDVSMRAHGAAALGAQRYVEALWSDKRRVRSFTWPVPMAAVDLPPFAAPTPLPAPAPATSGDAAYGDKVILSVGTEGGFSRAARPGASDVALLALMDGAEATLMMSQMELMSPPIGAKNGGPSTLPQFLSAPVVEHLGKALARGVDVFVVLSSTVEFSEQDTISWTYSHVHPLSAHPHPLAELALSIRQRLIASKAFGPSKRQAAVDDILCDKLHIAYLRTSEHGQPELNHAKVLVADDKAFYVGSQNLYPGGMADRFAPQLAEFGWIVDDEAATKDFLQTYWQPVWANSKQGALSGADRAGTECVFHDGE